MCICRYLCKTNTLHVSYFRFDMLRSIREKIRLSENFQKNVEEHVILTHRPLPHSVDKKRGGT